MILALLLAIFGIYARLNPGHVDNFVPIGAIALYAGARLPVRWGWSLPLVIMVVTDLVLDLTVYNQEYQRGVFDPTRLTVYGAYLLMVLLGLKTCRQSRFAMPVSMALLGSLIFFLTTNFAVWASGMSLQPQTAAGLLACYGDAVPFYEKTLVADFGYTVVFFGLDGLLRPYLAPRTMKPSGIEQPVS